MLRISELSMPLDHDGDDMRREVARRLGIEPADLLSHTVIRRGLDARRRSDIRRVYTVDAAVRDEARTAERARRDPRITAAPPETGYRLPARAPARLTLRPVVVGTGPCGMMAGLLLAQMGFRPLLIERGQPVERRIADTLDLWRRGVLHPESNVQFGEGGAGTFSDGKLASQVRDPRGLGRKVLEEFVAAGAQPDILVDARPHIGTSRLAVMVERMRGRIEALGGEFRFASRVEALESSGGRVTAVRLADGTRLAADRVVLAIGHSARDTVEQLHAAGLPVEAKPFSIGVRIEHPQALVDRARFGAAAGHPALGPADYKLVHHAAGGRAVYSFCMCPGGTVVAAASEAGGVVTNGMSQPERDACNANAALVAGVTPADYPDASPLAGIAFQRYWEARAFAAGGGAFAAPAQRVADFLAGRPSAAPGSVIPSYAPAVRWTDLAQCLPGYVVAALREAIPAFDRQVRGFAMDDAVLTGIETRTSSPVRIPRGADLESTGLRGLYPAGEGAGYAGGILSSAMDGIRVAEALARSVHAG